MELEISAPHAAIRDAARVFGKTEVAPSVVERDREGSFDRALFAKLAPHGLLSGPVPESAGGRGLGGVETALLFEGFTDGSLDLGIAGAAAAHTFLCAVPLWRHGTDAQRSRLLPQLCAGKMVGTASLSGPDDGFDMRHIPVGAEQKQGRWVLNGTSPWVMNAPDADVLIVCAATKDAATAFLVDTHAPGVTVEPALALTGLRTMGVADVSFNDCEVSMEAVLGDLGGAVEVVRTAISWYWAVTPAPWVGVLDALYAHVVNYARSTEQFARPIAGFQNVRANIVDMKIRAEIARRITYRACGTLDLPDAGAVEAAEARLFVAEAAQRAVLDAVQICAGEARQHGSLVERLYRDSMLLPVQDNAMNVMRSIVASSFLDLSDKRASA